MKEYYYTDGEQRFGPFTFDELKQQNISRNTLIWYEGLNNWTKAGSTNELSSFFHSEPPPIDTHQSTAHTYSEVQKPPKSWLIESILVTLFCCLPFGIAGIVNASRVESRFNNGDMPGAERASKEAKKWTKISLVLGLVIIGLYLIFGVLLTDFVLF